MIIVIFIISMIVVFCLVTHNVAVDSIGELKYMLRCEEKRKEMLLSIEERNEHFEKTLQVTEDEIECLKRKIQFHWGRKITTGREISCFDYVEIP